MNWKQTSKEFREDFGYLEKKHNLTLDYIESFYREKFKKMQKKDRERIIRIVKSLIGEELYIMNRTGESRPRLKSFQNKFIEVIKDL